MTVASAAVIYATVFIAPATGPVAVMFPPGSERLGNWAAVIEAGGQVIREELNGTVLVVQPDDDGFSRRARAAGAWFILNPLVFGGCGPDRRSGRGLPKAPVTYPST